MPVLALEPFQGSGRRTPKAKPEEILKIQRYALRPPWIPQTVADQPSWRTDLTARPASLAVTAAKTTRPINPTSWFWASAAGSAA